MTFSWINEMTKEQFVQAFGPIFEHSPWIAEKAWTQRPFDNINRLHDVMVKIVSESSTEKQLQLIRAHPDLVGRMALAGSLTPESNREQASAGLNQLGAEEVAAFQNYNAVYREKFGFPFVICARLNKKEAILRGFETRLKNSREQEIKTALDEIGKIAQLRLRDLMTK